ncbi:sigma-54 dependent transcriptional regulator [Thiotrichales bacterium 19S3-7]|nr:sigma-54 dependent transcriptional regulator [Thiotrichales bacterium 19S3-7]MCF6802423.1 sigma-54 dependent transcriptional regulator [Thiotrichales bacterium 19S3-11]
MSQEIYLIDDEQLVLASLRRFLKSNGFQVNAFSSASEVIENLKQSKTTPALIISDQRMPNMKGTELAFQLKKSNKTAHIPLIILSAYSDFSDITNAFNANHIDLFLSKPWRNDDLLAQISMLLDKSSETVLNDDVFHNLYGKSNQMKKLFTLIKKAAKTESSIILRGETGTGKELIARAIHAESNRKDREFLSINCANIHHDLFESQLFGFKKGAFTGADSDNQGILEAAKEGSIFFDEIGEIPLELQPKLLRMLQEKEYTPLGSTKVYKFNAKMIFATNRDLEAMVDKGTFRSDLYYRINVIPIDVPALRERQSDGVGLFNYFYHNISSNSSAFIDKSFEQSILGYHWPGNVRELKNFVERLYFHFDEQQKLTTEHFKQLLPTKSELVQHVTSSIDRKSLLSILEMVHFNQSQAAKKLNVSRMTIWRLMKKYNIDIA